MARESSSQSGHIGNGGTVTQEKRPPGPVPMRHLMRLGSRTAPTSRPNGVAPVRSGPTVKPTW